MQPLVIGALAFSALVAATGSPASALPGRLSVQEDTCTLLVGAQPIAGRRSAAGALTLCVPAAWTPAGERGWSGGAQGRLRWEPAARVTQYRDRRPPAALAPQEVQRLPWSEDVAGDMVDFRVDQLEAGRWVVRARWEGGQAFTGDASSGAATEVLVAVLRSARPAQPRLTRPNGGW